MAFGQMHICSRFAPYSFICPFLVRVMLKIFGPEFHGLRDFFGGVGFFGTFVAWSAGMNFSAGQKIISIAMLLVLAMDFRALYAAASASKILVYVCEDGRSDSLVWDVADDFSELLASWGYKVVEPAKALDLAKYHDAGNLSRSSQAAEVLARAKEDYFEFRYAEAVAGFANAEKLIEEKEDGLLLFGDVLLDVKISKAIIEKARGKMDAARKSIEEALRINPLLKLSEEGYPPSMIALFEDVRKNFVSGSGSISVDSKPPAVDIYLNGVLHGQTPMRISPLPDGKYFLQLKGARYDSVVKEVYIADGAEISVKAKLKWAKGASSQSQGIVDEFALARDLAEESKSDKVIILGSSWNGKSRALHARMFDSRLGTSHRPIIIRSLGEDDARFDSLASLAKEISSQLREDPLADPSKVTDPKGRGDPMILTNRKRKFYSAPWFWGAAGLVVAGAIAGGIAASMGGGGDGSGRVNVRFR